MLLEDVHWIDPTSLELFDLVIERIQRLPVLLVATARPEFASAWDRHPNVTTVALDRLDTRQSMALIARIAGDRMLPGPVLDRIVARADGVPLFLEELTKAVLESGLLDDEGDRSHRPPMAIPTTLQDSLLARLDRLAPVKEVAQIAAAIGREFPRELLAAVARWTIRHSIRRWRASPRRNWSSTAACRPIRSIRSSMRSCATRPMPACCAARAS